MTQFHITCVYLRLNVLSNVNVMYVVYEIHCLVVAMSNKGPMEAEL